MEIRLNKLISESGICSRREADKLIETGRVTINGLLPKVGQKVTEQDIVEVDGERIHITKRMIQEAQEAEQMKKAQVPAASNSNKSAGGATPRERYGKYNKYAAARKAAKRAQEQGTDLADIKQQRKETTLAQRKGSLGRSVIAQQMASSPKSAALRKTSRNNPANKLKRSFKRNNSSED